jgi:hypothetical protein
MGARAYGVVGGTAVVVLLLGLGSTTGIGNLGTIDPNGPRFAVPSRNASMPPIANATGTPAPEATLPTFAIPAWVGNAILVLVLGLAALVIGWFAWRVIGSLQRGRHLAAATASTDGTEIEEIPMGSLAESVEESLEDLRGGINTDDAILECWRRLERLGENAGAPRRESDTSTEYVERLLQPVPAAASDLAILARLYRSAMFSGLASDPVARQSAVECLERLSTTLSSYERLAQEVDGGA